MICNLCGSEDSTIIFSNARLEQHNIRYCTHCGLVFLETGKTQAEIEAFYQTEYRKVSTLPVQTPQQHYNDPVTKKDIKSQLEFILNNSEVKGTKVLEIGSASGGLLELLRNEGATVSGIELNNEYRDFSKSWGMNVFSNTIEHLAKHKKEYDIIVAFHVLEHIVNPMESIGAIFSCLAPNTHGIFMGEVPNNNEWGISIFDSEIVKQLHYNPYHYYYFTEKTLMKYLRANGFSWVQVETVERYNSLEQLRRILYESDAKKVIETSVFPKNSDEDLRLRIGDIAEQKYNRLFGKAINEEKKGNCLRFVAHKTL